MPGRNEVKVEYMKILYHIIVNSFHFRFNNNSFSMYTSLLNFINLFFFSFFCYLVIELRNATQERKYNKN